MTLLALSTSSSRCEAAIGENGSILASSDYSSDRSNRDLGQQVHDLLASAERTLEDLSHIIVDVGPGGTTSVRSGIAFANGLGYSRGIPVCPFPSLELAGIDAWEQYRVPVISTVRSVGGKAFVGFFNYGDQVSIQHGHVGDLIPDLVDGIDELAVVGFHRTEITNSLAHKKVIDTGQLYGRLAIVIEKSSLFLRRGVTFPRIVIPINEMQV